MIKLTIDGKEIQAQQGLTVLEAALDAEMYIPNLCWHPNLPKLGACRMCIVEIEGMRGLPVSCTTEAREGMVVTTNSEKIKNYRKNIVWLLLSEHPAELGENDQFRKVVDYVGRKELLKGFAPKERNLPIISDEPMIAVDSNKCILCGRCVRACQEVRGCGAIGFVNRGIETIVQTSAAEPRMDSGCKFCGACVEVCPTGALTYKEDNVDRTEKEFALSCQWGCPAHVDVPTYVRFIADGRYQDALDVIRETVPFPGSLGRVCPHPCQDACHRAEINDAIQIRDLKRFVADRDNGRWRDTQKLGGNTGKKVAIIGGGPAGLSAAWMLRKFGHAATVFEKMEQGGGMMRAGIPRYRLPAEVLDGEINDIAEMGVEIKYNTKIESLGELFDQDYDSVIIALGAADGMTMGIKGEEDPRAMDGLSVLDSISFGREIDLGKSIAVVGGGNVAMDVARTALRLGVEDVNIIYRRTEKEMPAWQEEIDFAKEEGVKMNFLNTPIRIKDGGECLNVICQKMELGEPDESGRRRPVPVEGSEYTMKVDRLIMAIGQRVNMPEAYGIKANRKGQPIIGTNTRSTSRKGVFAAGDMVTGPATVIEAIHAGRLAAMAADKFLGGTGKVNETLVERGEQPANIGRNADFAEWRRAHSPVLPLKERFGGMPEVEGAYEEKVALEQAERCLRCGLRLQLEEVPMPPEKSCCCDSGCDAGCEGDCDCE